MLLASIKEFFGFIDIEQNEIEQQYFNSVCQLIHHETECWDKALRAQGRGDNGEMWHWRQEAFITQGRLIKYTTGRVR